MTAPVIPGAQAVHQPVPGVTLVLGDARHVVPPEAARTVATDYPYALTSGGKSDSHFNGRGTWTESYANDGIIVPCDISVEEVAEVVDRFAAPRSDFFVMAEAKNIFRIAPALLARDALRFHNLLYWDKGTGNQNRWYMKNAEFTFFGFKGKARSINNPGHMAGQRIPRPSGNPHPTKKPVALMQLYIEDTSQPGDLVADPFMGSGTTGVAAVKAGRRFFGVEIHEPYFAHACARLDAALGILDPKQAPPIGTEIAQDLFTASAGR